MSEYKGFRIWNLEFQAMQVGQTNVQREMDTSTGGGAEGGGADSGGGGATSSYTGRLINTSTNARYWECTDSGLKSHLYDFLEPMVELSSNGVGWQLDTDTYSRLYNIVTSRNPSYAEFINRNMNIYDATNNPTGDKTIKLVPSEYVRVMCFKHSSGYKAMIGLSLYAMDGDDTLTSFVYNTSYSRAIDPGFLHDHILNHKMNGYSSDDSLSVTGGLFISMIPPKESGEVQDDWNLEYSMQDSNFYAPTMTPIVPFMHSFIESYNSSYHSNYRASSWLRVGTSTNYDAGNNSGVLAGTNMKLSLLLDTKGNIGISYKYTASTNTTSLNPIIIMGPLYKKKLFANDSLCTSKLGVIQFGKRDLDVSTGNSSYYNAAWVACYNNYYYNYFTGDSPYGWDYLSSFSSDASSFNNYYIYTAYPAVDSSVHLNYRNAKAGYTAVGLIDEEVIRWNASDGLVKGQTYNNGEWIYMGNEYSAYAQDGITTSRLLYPSIKWDIQYNDTSTFA